jgi:uncharacterized membrane protein YfcA
MNSFDAILILLFLVSLVYSSVGHGGASGYLAALSLLGMSPEQMRPAALVLNVFVSMIAFVQYYRGGHFRWRLFLPFAILSIPMAFLGSFVKLGPAVYKQILGLFLVVAVLRILGIFNWKGKTEIRKMPLYAGLTTGGILGFVSGMIGIGGGIILSPVILLFRWGNLKETAAVSALFILVNSLAGLSGLWKQGTSWPPELHWWILVAVGGGIIGSWWGSHRADNIVLRYVLAIVLLLAAIKLIFI